ncbi:MAG: hypothetical protein IJP05_00920 [Oscillospiraceae bacterium]|nr:hypothetical protein [Oscillospiraceae bacterium]MBQ6801611.1 hypothetical protein [Oscillospiraceae bacterium]
MNNEKIFKKAFDEFERLGIKTEKIEKMREKDGIALLKIKTKEKSFVFKYFYNKDYRREIKIYDILKDLGIETIEVFAKTEKSILMEDISESGEYRLGTEEDMSDKETAKALAKWYKKLHAVGYEYLKIHSEDFYSENAVITRENLAFIKDKTKTDKLPVWKIINDNFPLIKNKIESMKKTFNYNDFYYMNLVVSKDKSKAFMFDYNLFGKGPAYSDINNVCWSLSEEAKEAFLDEYGKIDEHEKFVAETAMVLSSLFFACKREEFPDWGKELLEELKTGFDEKIKKLIQ